MTHGNDAVPKYISVGMVSGVQHNLAKIFLYDEQKLREARALRISASGNLSGVSTGIGFWGSPEWALGGAIGLGILESLASNSAAKKGMSQLEEAGRLMASARQEGTFVPVKDIINIALPYPGSWRYAIKQKVQFDSKNFGAPETSLYNVSPVTEVLKSYAYGDDSFVLAFTLDELTIHIAWQSIESFLPVY